MPRVVNERIHSLPPYQQPRQRSTASPAHLSAFSAVEQQIISSSSGSPPPIHLSAPPSKELNSSTLVPVPGELHVYQKGKKVTAAQLAELLSIFAQDDNPPKEERIAIANRLEMSFKALSIWFQNERANVKKGRARNPPGQGLQSSRSSSAQSDPKLSLSLDSQSPELTPFPSRPSESPQFFNDSASNHSQETDDSSRISTPHHSPRELSSVHIWIDHEEQDDQAVMAAHILVGMKHSAAI